MSTPPYLETESYRETRRTSRGFFLSRRDLTIVFVGLAALGLLLFSAGLLLGLFAIGPLPTHQASVEPQASPPILEVDPLQRYEEPEPLQPTPPAEPEPEPAPVVKVEPPPEPEPEPEPEPKSEPPPVDPAATATQTIYEVQLGFFRVQENAEGYRLALQERGWSAYLVPSPASQGQPRYTVRLGPFPGPREAAAEAARFESDEGSDTMIRFRDVPASETPKETG